MHLTIKNSQRTDNGMKHAICDVYCTANNYVTESLRKLQ